MRELNQNPGGSLPNKTPSGVFEELGGLAAGTLVNEEALSRLLGKHPISIKRAVKRGELPKPTRLMGKPTWTAGAILKHIERRLDAEAEDSKRAAGVKARFQT